MRFIVNLIVSAIGILIASYIAPGVILSGGFVDALIVAVLLGVLNAIVGGVLRFITAPLNFLTLGLVSFLITVFIVMLVDKFVDGFFIGGFFNTAIFSLVLAIINSIFGFLGLKKK